MNQVSKDLLSAAHLAVSPAVNVPEEMRGHVRITPKGYNYYEDPSRIITPIVSGVDFPFGVDREEKLIKSIEDKYRVRFFLTFQDLEREATAYEIAERKGEQATLMGPQVDQLYREGIKPVFDIMHGIEDRARRLPPVPEIILEYQKLLKSPLSLNINLAGPLAQAQKRLFKMQPIKNAINELAPMAQIFPEVLDRVNADEMAEAILESANFPQHLIRSDEEVIAIRAEKQRVLEQQKAMEAVMGASEGYKNVTKAPESGSPAAALAEAG